DHFGIREIDGQRTDGQGRLETGEWRPSDAGVRALPDTAFGAAEINRVVVVRMDRDGGDPAGIVFIGGLGSNKRPLLRRVERGLMGEKLARRAEALGLVHGTAPCPAG